MAGKFPRKPFAHFFIKRDLQVRLILKIVLAVVISTLVTAATLLLVFALKYHGVLFYMMDRMTNLTKEDIISILLPTVAISGIANIIVALFVGLYASRKYAVPIYKLEQWASLLGEGNMTVELRFREKEEMKDLSHKCNHVTTSMRNKLLEIKRQAALLAKENPASLPVKNIQDVLVTLEMESSPIEVRTTMVHKDKLKEQ
jgi:methyl-accepting chemotaxis protein